MIKISETDDDLGLALEQFRSAIVADDPLPATLAGLDALMRAASNERTFARALELREKLSDTITELTIILGDEMSRAYSTERTYLLSTAANGVVNWPFDTLHDDRMLYLALWRSEIASVLYRRLISNRGDPLARSIAINRAWANGMSPSCKIQ